MDDLQDRFDVLDRTPAPDLWGEIQDRRPRSVSTAGPTPARRVVIVAVASVIAVAAIGFAVRAFDRSGAPAVTPKVPLPANGSTTSPPAGATVTSRSMSASGFTAWWSLSRSAITRKQPSR